MLGSLIIRQIVKSVMKNSTSQQALAVGIGDDDTTAAPRVPFRQAMMKTSKRASKGIAAAAIAVVVGMAAVQAVSTVVDFSHSKSAPLMAHLDAKAPVSQADLHALGSEYVRLFNMGGRQFAAGIASTSPFTDVDDLRDERNIQNAAFFDAGVAFQRKNNLFKEEIRAIADRMEQATEEFGKFSSANMQDASVALLAGAVTAFQGHSDALDDRIIAAVDQWKASGATRSAHAEQMGRFIRTEMAINPILLVQTAALLDEYRPVLDANEKRGLGRHIEELPEEKRQRAITLMSSPYLSLDEINPIVPGREALKHIIESDVPTL
jgi:hypothetical protein